MTDQTPSRLAHQLANSARRVGEVLRTLVPEATSALVDLTDSARVCAVFADEREVDTADDTGPFDTETLGAADQVLRRALDDATPADLAAAGWEHLPDEQSAQLYRITFPAAGGQSAMVEVLVCANDRDRYPAMVDPADQSDDGYVRPWFDLDTVRRIAADTQADAERHGHGSIDTVHVLDGTVGRQAHAVVLVICWMYLGGERRQQAVEVLQPNARGRYAVGGHDWCWYALDDLLNPQIPFQPTAAS
ncbi:hypothetical protein ACFU93_32525 [Streptomyces sp. NPDC057611]|uniref:hypothetical protein n=1 Tax=Streptomyces sp. NPDC057611 TaxID=3346182 RepID=UPI00367EE57B